MVLERDKKTWESLLTTPLTGREILGSKMRVVARNLRQAWRWMLPLWLLGVACDALHPLGALVALAGLASVSALGLAEGGRVALKPGATSQSANSQAALWMIVLMALGAATILAPLGSAQQFHTFWTRTPGRPASTIGLVAFVLALIVASALNARAIIRRNFARFDELVGRPFRREPAARPAPADRAGAASGLAERLAAPSPGD
jgi:hypothetical protein